VLNDHLLKGIFPGSVTGKLSDVAGMTLLPILIVATIELFSDRELSGRVTRAVVVLSMAGFALIETTSFGAGIYESALSWAQLPFRMALSNAGDPAPVSHVADIADLVALPAAVAVCLIQRKPSARMESATAAARRTNRPRKPETSPHPPAR
jgi:hypothetical protein